MIKDQKVLIEIEQGDITEADTEAIVNAANNHLWMGSGVAGAIKASGGAEIEKDAMSQGSIEIGEAIASTAGKLPFKCIIHAAGMGQDLRTNADIVYLTTKNTLLLAEKLKLRSIAFPAIGTGVGGLTMEICAEVMRHAVEDTKPELVYLKRIRFILFDKDGFITFGRVFKKTD